MSYLPTRLLSHKSLWLVAFASALAAVDLTWQFADGIGSARDLTIPEGSVVYSIRAVARGGPLYRDFSRPPYATTPYTPLYYLAAGALARLGGGGVDASYLAGRLLTTASTLACLVLVVRLARRAGATPAWATGAALLALTLPALHPWGFTCRPDMLAMALSLAGLDRLLARPGGAGAAEASLWFLASVSTKQSFVSAPMAALVGLAWRGSWRPAATLAACLAAGGAVGYAAAEHATAGAFGLNVVRVNVAPMKHEQPLVFLIHAYLAGGAFALLFALLGKARDRQRWDLPVVTLTAYAVLSLVTASLTSLKAGADINYFIEPVLAASTLAALGLRRWAAAFRTYPILKVPGTFFLTFLLAIGPADRLMGWVGHVLWGPKPAPIDKKLRALKGVILFGDSGLAVRSGRPILLMDKFNASYLADAGLIDFSPLVRSLEAQAIDLILLDHPTPYEDVRGQPWWPRKVSEAIGRYYESAGRFGDQYIYRPKKHPGGPAPAG